MSNNKSKLLLATLAAVNVFAFSASFIQAPVAQAAPQQTATIAVVEEHVDNKPYQVCRSLVKARPEQVWQVLTDYNSATNIFPNLKKCHVVSDKGATKIVHYQIHPSGSIACFEYDLEMKEIPHQRVEWHRVGGDFKEIEGFWKLEPADCGRSTIVTYASYCNGGIFLPQPLIKRQSRMDFPNVMAALKTRAERTTEIATKGAQHLPN